jgi:hypothetical protein
MGWSSHLEERQLLVALREAHPREEQPQEPHSALHGV